MYARSRTQNWIVRRREPKGRPKVDVKPLKKGYVAFKSNDVGTSQEAGIRFEEKRPEEDLSLRGGCRHGQGQGGKEAGVLEKGTHRGGTTTFWEEASRLKKRGTETTRGSAKRNAALKLGDRPLATDHTVCPLLFQGTQRSRNRGGGGQLNAGQRRGLGIGDHFQKKSIMGNGTSGRTRGKRVLNIGMPAAVENNSFLRNREH